MLSYIMLRLACDRNGRFLVTLDKTDLCDNDMTTIVQIADISYVLGGNVVWKLKFHGREATARINDL